MPPEQTAEQIAERIVRGQEFLCAGITEATEPYCACAPKGYPLCSACQQLATRISTELEALHAQRDALLEALKAIHDLLDGEIAERFRTSASKNEAEMGRRSVIYSLLSVPRNMAKAALQSIEAPSHD